jgi:hypothetical protein
MSNALKKTESIRKIVEAYETDSIFGTCGAATIYRYSYQSICNRLNGKNEPAPNIFISRQKIWSIEESVLIEYYIRNFKAGFLMIIQYFNEYVNELLKVRNSENIVNYYWYNNFFKRYPEIKSKFSRLINRKRINAENSDEFINFFRRFINTKKNTQYSIRIYIIWINLNQRLIWNRIRKL